MGWLTVGCLSIFTASICGIAFIVYRIIQEEKEKKEKAAFVRAFNKRYKNRL